MRRSKGERHGLVVPHCIEVFGRSAALWFTEEEYFNYKEYKRKKRTSPNYNPTEEERVAYNKYYRQKLKGLDAIAPFRKQEDPHIMEKNIMLKLE